MDCSPNPSAAILMVYLYAVEIPITTASWPRVYLPFIAIRHMLCVEDEVWPYSIVTVFMQHINLVEERDWADWPIFSIVFTQLQVSTCTLFVQDTYPISPASRYS